MRFRSHRLSSREGNTQMNTKMAGTIRSALVASAMACAILFSATAAFAGPPDTGPQLLVDYGFEGPANDTFADNDANLDFVPGQSSTSAFWGRTLRDKHTGTSSFWCAGTSYPSLAANTAWPYYLKGTRGRARSTFPTLADYYSSSVSMMYKMPSIGVGDEDYFAFVWRSDAPSGGFKAEKLPVSAGWRNYTKDLSASTTYPRLSRVPSTLSLEFYDYFESSINATGTGPVVDDFRVYGYKFGPVRNTTVSAVSPSAVKVAWQAPYSSATSSLVDTRTIAYRVWRAETFTDVWTELTASARTTSTSLTNVAVKPGVQYRYVVQAWDPGTGNGRGVLPAERKFPADADMPLAVLGAPKKPASTVYMWTQSTISGAITPAHPSASTVTIEVRRSTTGSNVYTLAARVGAGATTYKATGVKLPSPGVWYMRAKHSDSTHPRESISPWTRIDVSPNVSVTAPKVKSHKSRTYKVYGTIKPRHSSTYLKVYAYRWNGRKYAYVKSFKVSVTTSGQPADTTKYSSSVKFTKSGKWKLKVKHTGHSGESTKYSSYSSRITVK